MDRGTAAHAGHIAGGWWGTAGVVVVSVLLLVAFAIVMDRHPPD